MTLPFLNQRPIIVTLAGPNGAGKTTFYHSYLKPAGLRFVNADVLARELGMEAYPAAQVTAAIRRELVNQRESFVFETVFSDPVGDKREFLRDALKTGYTVLLCFIGLDNLKLSEQRVAMRVTQGGHDVPSDKLEARLPRTMANLRSAIGELPHVLVYDNSDLSRPFRHVATFEQGSPTHLAKPAPKWLQQVI